LKNVIGRDFKHQYQYKISRCPNVYCNQVEECQHRTQVCICLADGCVDIYEEGEHNSEKFSRLQFGMSAKAKLVVEDIIYNYDARPKRIHVIKNFHIL
jgi:hypothetical protein